MVNLGDIARVTSRYHSSPDSHAIAVYDTSHLVAIAQCQWYINRLSEIIDKTRIAHIDSVFPTRVLDEYERIYLSGRLDDYAMRKASISKDELLRIMSGGGIPKSQLFSKISDILEPGMKQNLAPIADVVSNYIKHSKKYSAGGMITVTDVQVIDCAYQFAKNGFQTYVLTEDSDITDGIERLKNREPNLALEYVSYFNLRDEWIANINKKLLISDKLLGILSTLDHSTSFFYSIGILRGQRWNMDGKRQKIEFTNDFAVNLHKQRAGQKLENKEQLIYFPLILIGEGEKDLENINYKAIVRVSNFDNHFIVLPQKNNFPPLVGFYEMKKIYSSDTTGVKADQKDWARMDMNLLRKSNPELEERISQIKST